MPFFQPSKHPFQFTQHVHSTLPSEASLPKQQQPTTRAGRGCSDDVNSPISLQGRPDLSSPIFFNNLQDLFGLRVLFLEQQQDILRAPPQQQGEMGFDRPSRHPFPTPMDTRFSARRDFQIFPKKPQ
ncbi:hypothetical protein RRG08_002946 [Elysia crispata]|uniref:Uncharacterized protein n=1 Tax=Elysia crispata TaxID=231223 RepID=A0AAE1AQR5_9GAST|nr:hypothetical protein RRG08_002946 [Elysia crispata]